MNQTLFEFASTKNLTRVTHHRQYTGYLLANVHYFRHSRNYLQLPVLETTIKARVGNTGNNNINISTSPTWNHSLVYFLHLVVQVIKKKPLRVALSWMKTGSYLCLDCNAEIVGNFRWIDNKSSVFFLCIGPLIRTRLLELRHVTLCVCVCNSL